MPPPGHHLLFVMTNIHPLRILFFGSDVFSNYSLRGLYNIHRLTPNLIESLQVVSRPPKWGGKKKSILRCPPILKENETLNSLPSPILCDNNHELIDKLMPVIQRDKINMLICVSFGLLIPQRLIETVPYTLNVHPSLLPKYRGSSPIQYALLNNDRFTGVTIQSLHPTKFDKGEIISQSSELDIQQLLRSAQNINEPPILTNRLTHQLGRIGSKMLCDLIQNGGYIKEQKNSRNQDTKYVSSVAPRIQTCDKLIQWREYDANQLCRRLMTLGPLYTFIKCGKDKHTGQDIMKRVILHAVSIRQQQVEEAEKTRLDKIPGSFDIIRGNHGKDNNNNDNDKMKMIIHCITGTSLDVEEIQIAGSVRGTPSQFFTNWTRQYAKNSHSNSHSIPAPSECIFISES